MAMGQLGIVVIGRNEGERLKRCLRSLAPWASTIVYVDSGSTDGSVEFALSVGVDLVHLDAGLPFTMGRARNEGFLHLRARNPQVSWVQFVDGDCEVVPGWIEQAQIELERCPSLAGVFGRRRERHPQRSIFNRLCDMEWNTPAGPAVACGGDAMMRASAFEAEGGFAPSLIAGEEPELCLRLRMAGWKLRRVDAEMTLHDAGITRVRQWWRRTERSGYAYAEGALLHGRKPERYGVSEVRSILSWGAALPVVVAGSLLAGPWVWWWWTVPLFACGACGIQFARIRRHRRRRGDPRADAALYGAFVLLGKVPQALGVVSFWLHRMRRTRRGLIEYK